MKTKKFLLVMFVVLALFAGSAYAEKDIESLRARAEQGNAKAQNDLGVCYHNGDGVEKNFAEAVKWYLKAAEQNYAKAFDNLGSIYQFGGYGVEKNLPKALEYFRKGAEAGVPRSMNQIGYFYEYGLGGLEKSNANAFEFTTIQAERLQ